MSEDQREFLENLLDGHACMKCGEDLTPGEPCAACAEKRELLRQAFPKLHGDA